MSNKHHQQPNWPDIILDIQTAPDSYECPSLEALRKELFPHLRVIARVWLVAHNFSDAHDDELAALGFDYVIHRLAKFKVRSNNATAVIRSLKSWAGKCSNHVWYRYAQQQFAIVTGDGDIESVCEVHTPSVEDDLVTEENADECQLPDKVREHAMAVLNEALNKFPPEKREAILATVDIKRIENPNARGGQGVAESIAKKYGYKPEAIRIAIHRLIKEVKDKIDRSNGHEPPNPPPDIRARNKQTVT